MLVMTLALVLALSKAENITTDVIELQDEFRFKQHRLSYSKLVFGYCLLVWLAFCRPPLAVVNTETLVICFELICT